MTVIKCKLGIIKGNNSTSLKRNNITSNPFSSKFISTSSAQIMSLSKEIKQITQKIYKVTEEIELKREMYDQILAEGRDQSNKNYFLKQKKIEIEPFQVKEQQLQEEKNQLLVKRKQLKINDTLPDCFLNPDIRNVNHGKQLSLDIEEEDSSFFNVMEEAIVKENDEGSNVISFAANDILDQDETLINNEIIAQRFYNGHFESIQKKRGKLVLVGNNGKGKSWFQWYMIYRWINQDIGSPRVIIQQRFQTTQFYFLREKKVFSTEDPINDETLNYFNDESSWYLYEPALLECSFPVNHKLPLVASVTNFYPYDKFGNYGSYVYVPCW